MQVHLCRDLCHTLADDHLQLRRPTLSGEEVSLTCMLLVIIDIKQDSFRVPLGSGAGQTLVVTVALDERFPHPERWTLAEAVCR